MRGKVITSTPRPGIFQITITRPSRRNALDMSSFQELADAWSAFRSSDHRVAVVHGANGDFSSGADLASISAEVGQANRQGGARQTWETIRAAVLRNADMDKPVIAAIEGICYGGGFELAGGCDLRIAGESARFAAPEVRHGVIASGGTLARLPRQIPRAIAMQMLLTGQEIGPSRLHEIGYLNEIVPDGSALKRALELASVIASNSPAAIQATTRVVRRGQLCTLDAAYAIEAAAETRIMSGADAIEGARAFKAKRRPSWVQ
ncbi:enoyl-CoA hydratase-related protein [Rhodococcus sp. IEGM 1366]|uniref:enoyl-CoA hydratase/isomerase family protein n=1 Tax=Rhodococcus sp. IEGM 1366 TaxID=3082223 RepID=UPI0029532DF8|nr:enoyl-CoA hydratase-related protein [Rhodococcus sp. IEGM 1366]MDV8070981.1 enoyl-CoA hydratase-related protein [Rhodococcus sp. IEGM 1366]